MGILIGSIVIGAFVANQIRHYEYMGFEWTKEKFGDIPIHTTQIEGKDVQGFPMNFKFALRNDPRELNVPIDYGADNRELRVRWHHPVYLSIDKDSEIESCQDAGAALIGYGYFMGSLGYDLKTGITNKTIAEATGDEYVVCNTHFNSTVFILTTEEESRIYQSPEFSRCQIVAVGNCEAYETMEKLQIEILKGMLPDEE